MYRSFTARRFRCFEDLTIEPLERINLIAGKNNVGKTALLEALWLHHGYHNPGLGVAVNTFRGMEKIRKDEFLRNLFLEFDDSRTIELASRGVDAQARSLHITIRERPTARLTLRNGRQEEPGNGNSLLAGGVTSQETTKPIEFEVLLDYTGPSGESVQARAWVETEGIRIERPPGIKEPDAVFLAVRRRDNPGVLAERLGDLAVEKKETKIVEILRIIEPRLEGLTVQHRGGGPVIYGDVGTKRRMPVPLMGDGMGRLLGIALAVPQAKGGLLLVDEIENGLHHTVMRKVWRAIAELAREYTVQIVATTHSEECVRAAHQAFAASEQYSFALHRLERARGGIRAVTFDQDTLDAAIEVDAEVR